MDMVIIMSIGIFVKHGTFAYNKVDTDQLRKTLYNMQTIGVLIFEKILLLENFFN